MTSAGLAAIPLLNKDTFKTVAEDDSYRIVKNGSQKIFDNIPIMQFTYLNQEKDWGFAPSGGIGFDFDKLSVFGGGSLYIGQNFMFSAGIAFHQQMRLDNAYENKQLVDNPISEDDLHNNYYRLNPYFSLTFRLDNNPFKKSE